MMLKLVVSIIYKIYNKVLIETYSILANIFNYFVLYAYNVEYGAGLKINGFFRLIQNKGARLKIGNNFRMNSGQFFNPIGRNQTSLIVLNRNSELIIGDNVGMSSVAIVCASTIRFGNNVRIGGNTVIYDTDFHSLNYNERIAIPEDKNGIKIKPIEISDNVFIGGHSIILKGTRIGENSIIGAGSVVSGVVPANEIWAGNPARFIKKLKNE